VEAEHIRLVADDASEPPEQLSDPIGETLFEVAFGPQAHHHSRSMGGPIGFAVKAANDGR